MKKLIFVVVVLALLACCSAAALPVSYRALHPNTPIYSSASYDADVIFTVPQNAEFNLLDESLTVGTVLWQKVEFGGYVGYVNDANIYEYKGQMKYTVKKLKATSKVMGEEIKLYKANSTESQVVKTVKDGTSLLEIITPVDYGDYYLVEHEDTTCFVEKQHATDGLTYNELTALIASLSAVSLFIICVIVIKLIKKSRLKPQND